MVTITTSTRTQATLSSPTTTPVTREVQQLEVDTQDAEDPVYPTGPKVWLAMATMFLGQFLNGIDLTIVAVAVPKLTDFFGTVDDIGWYSAAYMLVASAFIFFFGKACTVFPPKRVLLFGVAIFGVGSLVCTTAGSSRTFILGRALCGLGVSAQGASSITIIAHLFPSHKRSIWLTWSNAVGSIGLSCAPVIGGGLIDRFGWRACFGINLPLCPLLLAFTAYFLKDPVENTSFQLPILEKIKRLDLLGTAMAAPSISCLLMALQWGGIRYGWQDVRIITLLVIFSLLAVGFGIWQYRLGDMATVPPRILKKRGVLAAMWFSVCMNGILATTEYYISIYWQGVRNQTATQAGLLGLSMIVGLSLAGILAGYGVSIIGYFTPFMLATSLLAPIASGLLTTLDLKSSKVKGVSLLGFLGFAVGLGMGSPLQAISTLLPPNDVSIGASITGFGGGMGSALFTCASAALFQNRLVREISVYAPGTNITALSHTGLSDIRNLIGQDRLEAVLTGYSATIDQTLYMPLALTVLSLVGSASIGWPNVKRKQN